MNTSTHATPIANTHDFLSPTQFCQKFGFSHSTLSKYINKGDIALHQFPGEARPKINVAEALQVMSTIRRPYTGSALRLVRHDNEIKKTDLF
jgi:predicted DNA-binding transcriptional regulator AlpA